MSKRGTGKTETVECPACGERVAKIYLRVHSRTASCTAQANKHRMQTEGFREVSKSDLVWRALRFAHEGWGVPMLGQTVFTEFTPKRFGREEKKENTYWVPGWIADLFQENYELTRNMQDPDDRYARILARMIGFPDEREQVIAAWRLGGPRAFRSYVETPSERAAVWREQAAKLRAQAEELEAKARNELGE